MSLIDTLPAREHVTARELRLARDILIRKANEDARRRDEAEEAGEFWVADSYRHRLAQLDRAVDMLTDCLEGCLPNI
jgi:hypothetical protein